MVTSPSKPFHVSPVPTHSGPNSSAWFGRHAMVGPLADPQSLRIFPSNSQTVLVGRKPGLRAPTPRFCP